jgi:hypothetical protein
MPWDVAELHSGRRGKERRPKGLNTTAEKSQDKEEHITGIHPLQQQGVMIPVSEGVSWLFQQARSQ